MNDFWNALKSSWRWFGDLPSYAWRIVGASVALVVFLTVVAWKFILPLYAFAVLIVIYLRISRNSDSL